MNYLRILKLFLSGAWHMEWRMMYTECTALCMVRWENPAKIYFPSDNPFVCFYPALVLSSRPIFLLLSLANPFVCFYPE